jgi:hypothetical protein
MASLTANPVDHYRLASRERTRIRHREHPDADVESESRRRVRRERPGGDDLESESRRQRQRELDESDREFSRWAEEELERLREEEEKDDPASKTAMIALPLPEYGQTRERECAVCLDEFVAGGKKLRTMPCSHSFHQRCIFDWLYFNRTCPLCRYVMPSEKQRLLDEQTALAALELQGES